MKQKKLARGVFDECSEPQKNCWQLIGLEKFDKIYYAESGDCPRVAREIGAQMCVKFNGYWVDRYSLRDILGSKTSNEYFPRLSHWQKEEIFKTCGGGNNLIVCDSWVKSSLLRSGDSRINNLKIITSDIFEFNFFARHMEQLCWGLDLERRICRASCIVVLSSCYETWSVAVRLAEKVRETYSLPKIEMKFVLDSPSRKYNSNAKRVFAGICNSGISLEFVPSMDAAVQSVKERSTVLAVLPQHKSYLIPKFGLELSFVQNEEFGLLWASSSLVKRGELLEDMRQLAELHPQWNSARRFLQEYKPAKYPQWMISLSWFFRKLEIYRWSMS